jgi:uncharacterized membrane protein YfcA
VSAIHSIHLVYTFSGLVVGFLVGMTGVGGGSLMTPLLILLFGIHPATAVGTDLLHAAVTKTAGSLVHGLNNTIDWQVVRRLACGSVPASGVALTALGALDLSGSLASDLINVVLTVALVITALTLIFRDRIIARYSNWFDVLSPRQVAVLTTAAGAILGVMVSISSVGAGAIGVTALVLLYPKLPAARIVGSDIAHAVPLTLVGGVGHWMLGSVDLQVFTSLILGSVPGILLGSYVAVRIPDRALRLVLAGVLIIVATRLSFGLFTASSDVVAVQSAAPR